MPQGSRFYLFVLKNCHFQEKLATKMSLKCWIFTTKYILNAQNTILFGFFLIVICLRFCMITFRWEQCSNLSTTPWTKISSIRNIMDCKNITGGSNWHLPTKKLLWSGKLYDWKYPVFTSIIVSFWPLKTGWFRCLMNTIIYFVH